MATLVHHPLTNCQAIAIPAGRVGASRPGLLSRMLATLRLWHRRMRDRAELLALSERELRDMRASSADVWNETNQWFWRAGRPF